MPPSAPVRTAPSPIGLPILAGMVSWLGVVLSLQTILETPELASAFVSSARWPGLVQALGGRITRIDDVLYATIPLISLIGVVLLGSVILVALVSLCGRAEGNRRLAAVAKRVSIAWLPLGGWWLVHLVATLLNWVWLMAVAQGCVDLVVAGCLALTALAAWPASRRTGTEVPPPVATDRRPRTVLLAGMVVYVVVFTAMNWGLWFNLRLPHGDSAMYEEHLWNLEHGKGFRSYLDQGLFLGEHLQVVHVLLAPLHLLIPSHLTLEFAQSLILALGAWPLYRIARRHSGSDWAACLLGLAYLAYFPLQSLDIAIDLKTFRPNSFGIPALLAAIDQLERRRYGWASFWLAIMLSSQEDWAIPLALVGLWLAVTSFFDVKTGPEGSSAVPGGSLPTQRQQFLWGAGLFLFGVVYLWFALNVAIPWFRGGATVHTASYFSKFGNSPREIVVTMLTRPTLLLSTVLSPAAVIYALRLLAPIGFLPLLSPGRLLVAAPLFLLICMNDLAMSFPSPVHHFHAPLIPILFWAAAAGLGRTNADAAGAGEKGG